MPEIKVCTNEYCCFIHHQCRITQDDCLVCGHKLKTIRESTFNAMYADSRLQIHAKTKQILNPYTLKENESIV